MSFLDLAKSRYSVRNYKNQPVEPEKLEQILRTAHVAPTAANLQPVRLLVVREAAGLEKINRAGNIYGAPLAIIVCSDHNKAWVRPFDEKSTVDIDASIITDHMMLAAADLGLGSLWVGYFKPDVIREAFSLPDELEPVSILAMGYGEQPPADCNRHETSRIPMDQLVFYESL